MLSCHKITYFSLLKKKKKKSVGLFFVANVPFEVQDENFRKMFMVHILVAFVS